MFLDELAANATARNVSIIVYSGNNDLIISHRGSEGALASHIPKLSFSSLTTTSSCNPGDHIPCPLSTIGPHD